MKRVALTVLIGATVMLLVVPSGHAGRRHGPEVDFFIGIGPTYGYVPAPYYVYPRPYYVSPPPPVVYSAPFVVVPSPVYVTAPPPAYWYYCPSYGAYYPNVGACPQAWIPVPTR